MNLCFPLLATSEKRFIDVDRFKALAEKSNHSLFGKEDLTLNITDPIIADFKNIKILIVDLGKKGVWEFFKISAIFKK